MCEGPCVGGQMAVPACRCRPGVRRAPEPRSSLLICLIEAAKCSRPQAHCFPRVTECITGAVTLRGVLDQVPLKTIGCSPRMWLYCVAGWGPGLSWRLPYPGLPAALPAWGVFDPGARGQRAGGGSACSAVPCSPVDHLGPCALSCCRNGGGVRERSFWTGACHAV